MANRPRSLVLAAHGSLAAENSNQPLHDLASSIANTLESQPNDDAGFNVDVVTPAFLNGQPEMTNVLGLLPPGDVVIVPVMTSQGYYLRKLSGKFQENEGFDQYRLLMTPVIGTHPSIPGRIGKRISYLTDLHQLVAEETTVVIIGHGTRRNATSGQATYDLTAALVEQFPELNFETAFLDQDPAIETVAAGLKTPNTLIVPFLISRGPHSTEDVPQAFGLPSGPDIEFPLVHQNDGGFFICDLPVGMYPDIEEVCIELASDAISNNELGRQEIAEGMPS